MLPYPNISPEIITIGPFALRWYGLMYVLGFVFGFHILKARIRKGFFKLPFEHADSYITYLVVGMLLGARLVYVFVYNWPYYSMHPGEIMALWSGGLSFHGAMIGMILSSWLFGKKHNIPLHCILDTMAIGAAPALFVGRMGNFINGELYGRVTDSPIAMIFPTDPEQLPRYPSQLFQGLTEGILLFLLLSYVHKILLAKGKLKHGMLGAAFVAGYGFFRFFVEFTRQPDPHLGLYLDMFSMGQILCGMMIVASIIQWIYVSKTQQTYDPVPVKTKDAPKENWLEKLFSKFVT